MKLKGRKIGVAITGSFCTYEKVFQALRALKKEEAELQTIFSDAGTRILQYQHFKELPVIMHRNTPLLIVITDVTLISRICPAASYLAICPLHSYTTFPYISPNSFILCTGF